MGLHVTVVLRSLALTKPSVHRRNRVPEVRMRVVARSVVSPGNRGAAVSPRASWPSAAIQ